MKMIDIIITSSSRPQLYPFFWKSFKKMITYRNNYRIIIHEDFVFPEKSKKVINWIHNNIPEAEVITHSPPIGLGMALDDIIRNRVKSKYLFYLQEDWEFERPIDLDRILWTMDNHKVINAVIFNKIKNNESLNEQLQPEYNFSGLRMCLYHQWSFMPGIWRVSHTKKYWRVRVERPEGYFTNSFGDHDMRKSVKYCEKVIGAFLYGHTNDYRYVRHLGNDWRMAKWRLENGKPGGCHDEKRMDLPYMAPWIDYRERPVRKSNYNEKDISRILEEEAK